MKILFIWPNYDCPIGMSIGVAYLSSVLQQENFETKILHINDEIGYPYDKKVILRDIEKIDPDIVCISTGENHYTDMYDLSRSIKEKLGKNIAIGEIHATLNANDVFTSDSPFDCLIRGEGEWAIKELMVGLRDKKDISNIQNVWIKNLAPDSVWPPLDYLRSINYLPTVDSKYSKEYLDMVKKCVDDILINLESNDRLRSK